MPLSTFNPRTNDFNLIPSDDTRRQLYYVLTRSKTATFTQLSYNKPTRNTDELIHFNDQTNPTNTTKTSNANTADTANTAHATSTNPMNEYGNQRTWTNHYALLQQELGNPYNEALRYDFTRAQCYNENATTKNTVEQYGQNDTSTAYDDNNMNLEWII